MGNSQNGGTILGVSGYLERLIMFLLVAAFAGLKFYDVKSIISLRDGKFSFVLSFPLLVIKVV